WKEKVFDELNAQIVFASACGAIVMPIAVVRFFLPRVKKVLVTYFGIQLGFVILAVLVALTDNLVTLKIRAVLFLFPTCTLMLTLMDTAKDVESLFLIGSISATTVSFILLFVRMAW